MRIGIAAELAGTNTPTIRYYESIDLLPRALRQDKGQRVYSADDVHRLIFIRRCREFGFSIEQVRSLVEVSSDASRSCQEIREIAEAHLTTIRAKLAELQELERSMHEFTNACMNTCEGGPGPSCAPLVALRAGT
jgi:DNA-binding transcriptional MerR regulator